MKGIYFSSCQECITRVQSPRHFYT